MWEHYATLSGQYYVSARFAAQAGYVPLCGNLMHHAVELQLKCGLIKAGAVPKGAPLSSIGRVGLELRRILARYRLMRKPPEDADRYLQRKYRHSLRLHVQFR